MTLYLLAQSDVFQNSGAFVVSIAGILFYLFIFFLVIIGLIRLVRYLGSARKEQQLMRMEMTKIAGEVELIRKKLTEHPSENKLE
jgi:hypothetical protein